MPISFHCAHCAGIVSVGDEHAGKKGRCPHCRGVVGIPNSPITPAAPATVTKPAVQPGPQPVSKPAVKSPAATAPKPQTATPIAKPLPAARPQPPVAKLLPAVPGNVNRVANLTAQPTAAAGPQPMSEQQLTAIILNCFQGPIPSRELPTSYKFGIFASAVFMALLPLAYLTMVAGLLLVSIVTAITGLWFIAPFTLAILLFLVKPLFFKFASEQPSRIVTPETEPILFAFVERICQATNAPRPSRIEIDCDMNASARFTRGWQSMFRNDLTLTIGMPWVCCLSLQQMGGILAHEFGHFSQGAAMRLTYFTRLIDFWFERMVFKRDKLDDILSSLVENLGRLGFVFFIIKLLVYFSRVFFWLLLYAGRIVTGYMLQQMEYDADSYETRLCGSESFAHTCERLELLGLAWHEATSDLDKFLREGRLVDNFPRLIRANVDQYSQEIRDKMRAKMLETKSDMFSSHPATRDRIAHAQQLAAPGVFRCDLPAAALFRDFDLTSKRVSWDFYYSVFGNDLQQHQLVSVDLLLARKEADIKGYESRNRFFAGLRPVLRQLRLPTSYLTPSTMSAAVRLRLEESRRVMSRLAAAYKELYRRYDELDTQLICTDHLLPLLRAGIIPTRTEQMPVWYGSAIQAKAGREWIVTEMGNMSLSMEEYETAASLRLFDGLTLFLHPQVAAKIENGTLLQEEAQRLLTLVGMISGHLTSLLLMRNNNGALGAVVHHLSGGETDSALFFDIRDLGRRQWEQIRFLRPFYEQQLYPFDHAGGRKSVAEFILPQVPLAENISDIHEAAEMMIDRLLEIYGRGLGRLCEIAERVEAVFGLQPLDAVA